MSFTHWAITLIVGGAVFLPLLVIALVRFRSAAVAFAVAASFSMGAMLGFFLSVGVANMVIPRHIDAAWYEIPRFLFATAGSIGGATIALWLLRKLAGGHWRQR